MSAYDHDSRYMDGRTDDAKSFLHPTQMDDINAIGRSYYIHCLETALAQVSQARMLMMGEPVDDNHELPLIERKLAEALQAC